MIRQSAFTLGVAAVLMTAAWDTAVAEVALQGSFTATKLCPALQSIRKATNPGSVELVVGRAYEVLAQNAQVPTHYRIRIEGAEPAERWVGIDCGTCQSAAAASGLPKAGGSDQGAGTGAAEAVLALSWEPSFCAGHASKPECAKETAGSFDATHFSLHGLWPQPQSRAYCNVARPLVEADKKGDWAALPAVDLSAATRDRLNKEMPGTQSFLERHEWIKHGTCYGGLNADAYFAKALSLADEVNASAVQKLFASKIGQTVTGSEIRAAFDSAFGAGTGDRVRVSCAKDRSGRLFAEMTIGLAGSGASLAVMMKAVDVTDPGCPSGIVEAAAAR